MTLSPEHVRVLYLVAQGLTDEHIARLTSLGRSTVQRLIAQAAEALDVTGRVALVVRAIQVGIIDPNQLDVKRRPQRGAAGGNGGQPEGFREPL